MIHENMLPLSMRPNTQVFSSISEMARLFSLLLLILSMKDANAMNKDNIMDHEPENNMVKMCLFYDVPAGSVRTDPIISQECTSDHVHTFYGPKQLHPDTTYEDLVNTPPNYSTSPVEENQSLYWVGPSYSRSPFHWVSPRANFMVLSTTFSIRALSPGKWHL